MTTIAELCSEGLAHHRAGRLSEAEAIYRQVLTAQPNMPEPWYLLGVLANQVGKYDAAVQFLEQAIRFNANSAEACCALGTAFEGLGNVEQAIARYRQAVEIRSQFPEAHFNLANLLRAEGQTERAISHYRETLELRPEYADALNNLGLALKQERRLDEAECFLRRAVALNPDRADFHRNLGVVLHDQGRLDDAVQSFRCSLALNSQAAQAHNSLAAALKDQLNFADAENECDQALTLEPHFAEAHINLGQILQAQRKLAEASESYQRAIAIWTDGREIQNTRGPVDAGKAFSERAQAHFGLATLRLSLGDFQPGWEEYEWRWHVHGKSQPERGRPSWNGGDLAGRTILLWAEQGLGDTLQFIRYAPLVKARRGAVVVECMAPLGNLLARCPGVDRLIGRGDDLPPFDVHAPLLSLPRIFQTRLETIPPTVPYLLADTALTSGWRAKLNSAGRFFVGVNWCCGGGRGSLGHRDIPLHNFARLAEASTVSLVALQKGEGKEELVKANALGGGNPAIIDLGDEVDTVHGAFMDTAAIMMNLDLVITSDTAVAHLAGALGVPVWVALPFVPDWRWMLDRSDSPWYPTMRLFRQREPGDWAGVFEEIRAALEEVVVGQSELKDLRHVKDVPH